jgi:hypothetical protein
MKSMRKKFDGVWKSWQAMKQANITMRQLPGMGREFSLWLRITRNLREIEGSWPGALRKYMWIFTGVPRKHRSRLPDPDVDKALQKKI